MADYTQYDVGKVLYHCEVGGLKIAATNDTTHADRPLKMESLYFPGRFYYFVADGRFVPEHNTTLLFAAPFKAQQNNITKFDSFAIDSPITVSNNPDMSESVVRKFHGMGPLSVIVYANGGSSLTTDDTEMYYYWQGSLEYPPTPPAGGGVPTPPILGPNHFLVDRYDNYTPWHVTQGSGEMLSNTDTEFPKYPVKVGFPDSNGVIMYFDMLGRDKDEFSNIQTLYFYPLDNFPPPLARPLKPSVDALLRVWDFDENTSVLRYFADWSTTKMVKMYANGQDSQTTDGTYEEYMTFEYV